MKSLKTIKNYLILIKPRQTLLLTYTGICSFLIADLNSIDFPKFFNVFSALLLSISGATALTNYVDKDIDSIMSRTKSRPLPKEAIKPPLKALWYGVSLIVISLFSALKLNLWFILFLALGIINSVIVYNLLLKRRTSLNILIASPVGAMPIIGGWSAVKPISIEPIIMSIIIILWIPIHVWSLALRWRDDYLEAKIPMLPLKMKDEAKIITFACMLLVFFSLLTSLFLMKFSLISVVFILFLNIILTFLSINLRLHSDKRRAWVLFKFSGVYVLAYFTIWLIDSFM